MVSTTYWGRSPRTSVSCPGNRHEVSRGLDAGVTRCPVSESVDPSSEESLDRGCHEEHQLWELGQSGPVWCYEQDLLLVLPDLAQCLLTEGNAYLQRPARPCRVFPLSGSKTTGNEKSLGTRTGLPVRVRNVYKSAGPSGDGVSTLRGAQLVTARQLPG